MSLPTITPSGVNAAYPSDNSDETLELLISHATDLIQLNIFTPYDGNVSTINDRIASAIIHQVGYWIEVGDTSDTAGWDPGTTIEAGGVKYPVGPTLAKRAKNQLTLAGLRQPRGA